MPNRTLAVASLLVLAACSAKKDDTAAMDTAAPAPAAMAPAEPAPVAAAKDIIETATAAGTFNTLS